MTPGYENTKHGKKAKGTTGFKTFCRQIPGSLEIYQGKNFFLWNGVYREL